MYTTIGGKLAPRSLVGSETHARRSTSRQLVGHVCHHVKSRTI